MELEVPYDTEHVGSASRIQHDLWPLDEIDIKKAKFPCCLVWTPLPVVSWLAPFIGHVGVCREDGVILDFAVSNFVNVDNFAFGAAARYLQLDRRQCCFPPNLSGHSCEQGYQHSEFGTAITWDDALRSTLILFKGHWIDAMSVIRSFLPFTVVLCLGVFLVGWPFVIGLFSFSIMLMVWFLLVTYCFKSLLEC